jgi:hypothetical protein
MSLPCRGGKYLIEARPSRRERKGSAQKTRRDKFQLYYTLIYQTFPFASLAPRLTRIFHFLAFPINFRMLHHTYDDEMIQFNFIKTQKEAFRRFLPSFAFRPGSIDSDQQGNLFSLIKGSRCESFRADFPLSSLFLGARP